MSSQVVELMEQSHPIQSMTPQELRKLLQFYLSCEWVTVTREKLNNGHVAFVINYKDIPCNQWDVPMWEKNPWISWARGLLMIVSSNGDIVKSGNVMMKFHSIHRTNLVLRNMVNLMMMPKFDGSLVYVMVWNDVILAWTRKGFASPQASKYIWDFLSSEDRRYILGNPGMLLGFELVHPKDPKVQYTREPGLVLLFVVDASGYDVPRENLNKIADNFGPSVSVVKLTPISGLDLLSMVEMIPRVLSDVVEGWVIVYQGTLFKVKQKTYLTLANGISWEGRVFRPNIPTPKSFSEALKTSETFPPELSIVKPPRGLKIVPPEVNKIFEESLGPLIKDMYDEWDKMIEKLEFLMSHVVVRVRESLFSVLNDPKKPVEDVNNAIDSIPDKKSLGTIFGLIKFVSLKMGPKDILDPQKRELYFSTDAMFRFKVMTMVRSKFVN